MDTFKPGMTVEVDATKILGPLMETDEPVQKAKATVHPDGHITVAYEHGAAAHPLLPGDRGYLEITAAAREAIEHSVPFGPAQPDTRAADSMM